MLTIPRGGARRLVGVLVPGYRWGSLLSMCVGAGMTRTMVSSLVLCTLLPMSTVRPVSTILCKYYLWSKDSKQKLKYLTPGLQEGNRLPWLVNISTFLPSVSQGTVGYKMGTGLTYRISPPSRGTREMSCRARPSSPRRTTTPSTSSPTLMMWRIRSASMDSAALTNLYKKMFFKRQV